MRFGARLTLLLGVLTALAPAAIDSYVPAFPEMSRDLTASPSAVQLTITAFLIGLALGQLLGGPLSDRYGRRRPLLAGLAGFTVLSVLCALAPDVWTLIGLRVAQGVAGAFGMVIARAIVRDRSEGVTSARFFARLMLISGLAPIVAPIVGAALLEVGSWRTIFAGLGGLGAVTAIGAWAWAPESLPPASRQTRGFRDTRAAMRALGGDPRFVGYVLASGLVFGSMFCYLSGATFVLQDVYGFTAQGFALVLAANSLGVIAASQASRFLVGSQGPTRLLVVGVHTSALGGLVLLVGVLTAGGLWTALPSMFLVVASVGLVMPNAAALALADQARRAGSAAALLGTAQYAIGGTVAPLVGIGGRETALPMALAIAVLSGAAVVVLRFLALAPRPRVRRSWVPFA